MIEFKAFDFQGCKNVTQLAYQLLEEFIWSEITDLTELLDEVKEETEKTILTIEEVKNQLKTNSDAKF